MSVNLNSFPFDSKFIGYTADGYPDYDRKATSADLAEWMAAFFGDGVFGADAVSVTANGDMSVNVGGGIRCLIRGRYGKLGGDTQLEFADAASNLPRIDTIVLRMSTESAVRRIVLDVVQGTAAASPEPPELTRTGSVWELGIADVTIRALATEILQTDIQNTVLDSDRCGIVAQAMTTLDTTYYYQQIAEKIAELDGMITTKLASLETAIQQITLGQLITRKEYTATLTAAGWVSSGDVYTQTVTISGSGISSDQLNVSVVTAPGTDDFYEWCQCGVHAVSTGTETVTFEAKALPSEALTAHVAVVTGGMSA